ncbi:MAG: S8 family serine peptidase [Patescibacteria group bacterium]
MLQKKSKKIIFGVLAFFIFGNFIPAAPLKAQEYKFYLAGLAVSDTDVGEQWHLDKIKAPDAWEKTQGNKDIVVAVIDTGVDLNHPDLINNIWINAGEIPNNGADDDNNGYIDDVHGWNFIERNNIPEPNLKNKYTNIAVHHGTAVAGVIAAEGNNAFAGAGVAWQAKIMPLKVFNEMGESDTALVEAAIQYAIDKKADIINMSFVGIAQSPSLEAKIKAAYDAGILLVAAAGNESKSEFGSDLDISKSYPVCHDSPNGENWVLGVAAVDKEDTRASFSNYGAGCVDISAPGTKLYSTFFQDSSNPEFAKYFGGAFSGTSVATPQVVGAAVLIKALHPNYKNKQLIETIKNSTDNIDGANPYYLGKLGTGRLNVLKAVLAPAISMESETESEIKYVVSAKQSKQSKIWLLGSKGDVKKEFLAFSPGSPVEVNLSIGDIDNDGMAEIVAGAGMGGGPHIRIFNLSGELEYQFFAFDKKKRNGVLTAIGDIDGDGKNEIIAVEGGNSKPVARIFNERGEFLKEDIKIFTDTIKGAIGLALGDVNNDGIDEIIASTPAGIQGKIKILNSFGEAIGEFAPYGKSFIGGINIATGNFSSSGWMEIIASKRSGDSGIRTYDYTGRLLTPGILAYGKSFGANISSGDKDGDGVDEIITASNGLGGEIKIWDSSFNIEASFYPFGKSFKKSLNAYIITRK